MKTEHTPGPWVFDEVWHLIKGPKSEEIAAIHAADAPGDRVDKNTAHANARLIAATPELLAALIEAVIRFDYTVAALAQGQSISIGSLQNCAADARSAINKATLPK